MFETIFSEHNKILGTLPATAPLATGLVVPAQSRISRTSYPQLRVAHAVTRGLKFQSRHHLEPQRKLRSPNWNMMH